jgi:apolipoprotein N-acyltransferase
VVFPWITVNKPTRPDWILNVTNDAWFGNSPGPYQHFAMARMRAVEQGLPLVRAANTGISAVIDPYGRILRALPLGARGVIDQTLPKPLAPTVYAAWGEMLPLFLLTLLALFRWWHSTRSNPAAVSASPG